MAIGGWGGVGTETIGRVAQISQTGLFKPPGPSGRATPALNPRAGGRWLLGQHRCEDMSVPVSRYGDAKNIDDFGLRRSGPGGDPSQAEFRAIL